MQLMHHIHGLRIRRSLPFFADVMGLRVVREARDPAPPTTPHVDLESGQVLQTLGLPGSGTVTGLARNGTVLYAFVSGSDTFVTIDISTQGAAVVRGSGAPVAIHCSK